MRYHVQSSGKVRVLDLSGNIRIADGDTGLHDAVTKLLDEGHCHILANLSDVPFIDTMGLGEMVVSRKKGAGAGRELQAPVTFPDLHEGPENDQARRGVRDLRR